MVTALGSPADLVTEAGDAAKRAREQLLEQQVPGGWWKGELRTNVTMDAEDLLLRQFLGILAADELAESARWIRSQQREDGTWATFHGGPGDLSTTVEAYVALRLAGDLPDAEHLRRARAAVLARGGLAATRVFTRIWLALFGQWSWDDLPAMPPELIMLPAWFPLNVYDWACWARQTVVPLTIVATMRPVRALPFTLEELRAEDDPGGVSARLRGAPDGARATGGGKRTGNGRRTGRVARAFQGLDTVLKAYERSPVTPGRGAFVPTCDGMDSRAAGVRRRVGWYPAALGLFDPRPLPARLFPRPSGPGRGDPRAGGLPRPGGDRRRGATAAGGMPVTGVGHLPGGHGAAGFGNGRGRDAGPPCRPVAAR